jgi:transposase IS116/IS110/IS902 family protein
MRPWPLTSPPKPASRSSSRANRPPPGADLRPLLRRRPRPHPGFRPRCRQDPRRPDPRPTQRPPPVHQPGRARSFSGLIPHQNCSGLTDATGSPTKHGDACLREALFLAADHARKTDPTLAARDQRLMCQTGRHHTSALSTIATVLCTRIVACLRNNTLYQVRDVDGSPITPPRAEGSSPSALRSHPKSVPPDASSATPAAATADGTSASSKESLSAPRRRPSHRPA